jgi:hypothetical protein
MVYWKGILRRAGAASLALIVLMILILPASGATLTFSDNNLIQGYSIDLYAVGNLSGAYNTSLFSRWNSTSVSPITLSENGSYIGIIRQNQVARFNNMNELSVDIFDWVQANYVGMFLFALLLLIVSRR